MCMYVLYPLLSHLAGAMRMYVLRVQAQVIPPQQARVSGRPGLLKPEGCPPRLMHHGLGAAASSCASAGPPALAAA